MIDKVDYDRDVILRWHELLHRHRPEQPIQEQISGRSGRLSHSCWTPSTPTRTPDPSSGSSCGRTRKRWRGLWMTCRSAAVLPWQAHST